MKKFTLIFLILIAYNAVAQDSLVNNIIKEYEAILKGRLNYKVIDYYNLPEYYSDQDIAIITNSQRSYFFNDKDKLIYIVNEIDNIIGYSPPQYVLNKHKEEFLLRDGKLINYRELTFGMLPFKGKGSPIIKGIIDYNHLESYGILDTTIKVMELLYFFKDSACIKIENKEVVSKIANNQYKESLKVTLPKDPNWSSYAKSRIERYGLAQYLANKGGSYQEQLKILRTYLKGHRSEGTER